MIQPNKIENKKNIIIINNAANTFNDIKNKFNELFTNYYIKVVKYSYYIHEIITMNELDTYNRKIIFAYLNININCLVLGKIINYLSQFKPEKVSQDILSEIVEKEIEKARNNKVLKNEFEIFGNVNIKLWVNQRSNKYTTEKDVASDMHSENIVLSFVGLYIRNACEWSVNYEKLTIWYFCHNLTYPILTQYQNNIIKVTKDHSTTITWSDIIQQFINVGNGDYRVSISKIFVFVNPVLMNNVWWYVQLFIKTTQFIKKSAVNSFFESSNLNASELSNTEKSKNNSTNTYASIINLPFKWNIEEMSLIFVSNLAWTTSKYDLIKWNKKNETIFRFLLNPLIRLKFSRITYSDKIFEIKEIIALWFKTNNEFQTESLVFQYFISNETSNIQSNLKNFEYWAYNASDKVFFRMLLTSKTQIDLYFNDIVLCPIIKIMDEMFVKLEHARIEYWKMVRVIMKNPNILLDWTGFDKQSKGDGKWLKSVGNEEDNWFEEVKISCTINYLYWDIYSKYNPPSCQLSAKNNLSSFFTNNKNKIRFISKVEKISICSTWKIEDISLSFQGSEGIFIKDLDIHPETTSLLYNNNNVINYFQQIGFAEIYKVNDWNIMFSTVQDNYLSIKDIHFFLCEDSLKYLNFFVLNCKRDISKLQSIIISSIEDDRESIITDIGNVYDNHYWHEQWKHRGLEQSTIEFKSVGKAYSDARAYKYKHKTNLSKSMGSNNSSYNKEQRLNTKDNTIGWLNGNENTIGQSGFGGNEIDTKMVTIKASVSMIILTMYSGEDFNFRGKYNMNTGNYPNQNTEERDKSISSLTIINIPSSLVEKENIRNESNCIRLKFQGFKVKIKYNENVKFLLTSYTTLKQWIIEDNILLSKYKKILSHYHFDNESNILFAMKFDIILSPNANREHNINMCLDLSPISVYLDQITLEFLLKFFDTSNSYSTCSSMVNDNDSEKETNLFHSGNYAMYNKEYPNDTTENEVSQMNCSQYKGNMFNITISWNPNNYYVNKLIINPFFISFTYNAREFTISQAQSKEESIRKYWEWLNLVSVTEMKIEFKEFNSSEKKGLKDIYKSIYKFYKEDIVKEQIYNSYFQALPFINNACRILDGIFDMAYFPIESYNEKIAVGKSLVKGVRSFVVNTASELLTFSESASSFLQSVFCVKNERSMYRTIRYNINEENKKKDKYYLKETIEENDREI